MKNVIKNKLGDENLPLWPLNITTCHKLPTFEFELGLANDWIPPILKIDILNYLNSIFLNL